MLLIVLYSESTIRDMHTVYVCVLIFVCFLNDLVLFFS